VLQRAPAMATPRLIVNGRLVPVRWTVTEGFGGAVAMTTTVTTNAGGDAYGG
jgi:hypothetical protein